MKPVPWTSSPGSPQLVCSMVRSADATASTILTSRSSATFDGFQKFEITGRFMMLLVSSCTTGKSPQSSAGATCREPSALCMLTASQPHARPRPHAAKRKVESTLHKNHPPRFCSHEQIEFPSDRGRLATSSSRTWCGSPPQWRRSAARRSVPTEC